MVFVIDDDIDMANCLRHTIGGKVKIFTNAIEAMSEISNGELPDLIFLDILLDGPDGFTFLNELVSYSDTDKIPVVIVSSFEFKKKDLAKYGVVGVLNKDTMLPSEIKAYAERYT